MDELLNEYAAKGEEIYENRTAGDHTWLGFLVTFMMEAQDRGLIEVKES